MSAAEASDVPALPPSLAKITGATSGGALALIFAYHTMIIAPMFMDHSSRPHTGVSAGLSEVRTNEAKIELLGERLDRIEGKIDRLIERPK